MGRVIASVPLGLRPGEPVPRLVDAVVEGLRVRHYPPLAERTEKANAPKATVSREVTAAVRRAGIGKRATGHTFRHSKLARRGATQMGEELSVGNRSAV